MSSLDAQQLERSSLAAGTLGGHLRALADAPPETPRPALVVQGGGMRAVYSMAALAVLEELGLRDAFSMVIASSAGVLNGAYFLAGQARESVSIYIENASTSGFISPRRFWKVIDVDHMVDVTLKRHHPLDQDALAAAPAALHAVLADAETAEARVIRHPEAGFDIYEIFRATVAIPIFYNRKVALGERRYVDGGIADLVPLAVARELGAVEAVLVMTRVPGHRKLASGPLFRTLLRTVRLGQSSAVRARVYEEDPLFNQTMEELESERGRIPRTTWTLWPNDVGRLVERTNCDRSCLDASVEMAKADTLAFLGQPKDNHDVVTPVEPGTA